ncbi:MAG: hypothetical protein NTY03_05450 [Candidatus Bathyarchaeota archaeon]|nr:hypothetical protein [Candidatus Bathyarchaeota archaeon]
MSGYVDTGSLFGEINEVFKRYGVGKGVGFVPDRLEVTMDRATSGVCTLVYREFFTYLPPEVMAVAMGNAVEFLSSIGIPRERIKPLDSGVEVTLEGDARIAYFPMLEMLIQDKGLGGNVDSALDSLKGSIHSMMELFEIACSWDTTSEEMWRNNNAKLNWERGSREPRPPSPRRSGRPPAFLSPCSGTYH